jgi:hypothetical protein
MKKAANIATLIVVLMTSTDVFADGFQHGNWGGHMWGGGMVLGPLMMLGFFALFFFWPRYVFQMGSEAHIAFASSNE